MGSDAVFRLMPGLDAREESEAVSAPNRLTVDQLAALTAGDSVAIQVGADFGKRRHRTGRVVRVDASSITVNTAGARGGAYIECFGRRDGVRIGGLEHAELVNPDGLGSASKEQRQQSMRIDALYREWTRNRQDVDRLRRLYAAISECLESQAKTVQ
jgi:hypothetical protein